MKTPKSFEDGIARLETILAAIQDESTPLAESVKLYSEAAALLAFCSDKLETAKLQIEEIDRGLPLAQAAQKGDDSVS